MPIAVDCVCGRRLVAPDQFAGTRARCPTCGRTLDIPLLATVSPPPNPNPAAGDESLRTEEPVSVHFKEFLDPPKAMPPKKPKTVSLAHIAQTLLDPRSIHVMLIVGGSLCVLGLII